MKKLYLLILILNLFLISCSSKDSVTQAVTETPVPKISVTYSEDDTQKSIFVGDAEQDYVGNFELSYTDGKSSASGTTITVTPGMIELDTSTVGEKVATIKYNNLTTTVSALVCTTASAFEVTGNKITKYNGTDETVVVPKYIDVDGNKITVTTLGSQAFYMNATIKSVIANNIVTIEDKVFYRCDSLEALTLAKTQYIGNDSMRMCKNLLSVYIPEAITIGNAAFYHAEKLTSISVPNVTSIGNWAFGNTALTNISIPKVTSIGEWTFAYVPLTNISILNVTSIGRAAFSNCTNLTNVTFSTTTPPTLGINVFQNGGTGKDWNISVPELSKDAYVDIFNSFYYDTISGDTYTFYNTKIPTINGNTWNVIHPVP